MLDLLYCEFLKLKRARMFFVCLAGSVVAPLLAILGWKLKDPTYNMTWTHFMNNVNLYTLLLFGIMVYAMIASYLFSREYTEKTLKTILPIPISKRRFIASKFLMLYLLVVILTAVTWVASVLFCTFGGAADFSWLILVRSLGQYFIGATLLYLLLGPFVFATLWLKNTVSVIIFATIVALINVMAYGNDIAQLFPWAEIIYLINPAEVVTGSYPLGLSLAIMLAVIVFGFVSSIAYFCRTDVK